MHEPATKWKNDRSSPIKELLGKWLFVLYALLYGGFMFINVTSPDFMGHDIGGINVAIAYGFILIISAMILAFAYNHVCTHAEEIMNRETEPDGEIAESGGKSSGESGGETGEEAGDEA